MSNILDAFVTLKNTSDFTLQEGESGNSIQIVGGGLERFVKDLFADSLSQKLSKEKRLEKHDKAFSYHGNANQPPDAILKNGDVIEVKKVDGLNSDVQLNSSPPKKFLLSSDTRINKTCRQLAKKEKWTKKDIFYAIGSQKDKKLRRLWFIYGDCYAASHDKYEVHSNRIKKVILEEYHGVALPETNEIAGIPSVDPLGITRLRVRGMWIIKNPSVVFSDYIKANDSKFKAYCILRADKYNSFPEKSRQKFEAELSSKMSIKDIKIPDPDNPANILNAKLIKYEV